MYDTEMYVVNSFYTDVQVMELNFSMTRKLFSKAYHPFAQQYFSAGPLPPPLLHPLLGGPLLCSLLGDPLPCSLLGGSTSMFTSRGSTSMFTSGGSTSMFTSRGSQVTYPIMLLYTTIECPSASWAKFTWDPPLCVHFWGVLCDLSHNALIYHYRMSQCIMGKIHMGPPPPQS